MLFATLVLLPVSGEHFKSRMPLSFQEITIFFFSEQTSMFVIRLLRFFATFHCPETLFITL